MEKEILNEYVKLIDKGYCEECNELNCIDNFPHKKIASAISDLQLENTKLKGKLKKQKEVNDKAIKYVEDYTSGERIITYEQYKSELLDILEEGKNE